MAVFGLGCQLMSQHARQCVLRFDRDDQQSGVRNVVGLAGGARDERVRAATDPQRGGECLCEQTGCFDIRAQEVSQLGGRLIGRRALLPPRSERR